MAKQQASLFQGELVGSAIKASFIKLNPVQLIKNPVMFTVEIGTAVMLLVTIYIALSGETNQGSLGYNSVITFVLLLTILFANFAEAIAEARGKAQAESLRKTRQETPAKVIRRGSPPSVGQYKLDEVEIISSAQLKKGDVFLCEAGDLIPSDGEIIEGLATIDESAITGESAPVIREAGGDKSSVTGGTKVLSDKIKVIVTTQLGESFLDKMIALVEGASRQKTPNEIALTILLAGFTLIFVIVCVTLQPFAVYARTPITIAALISLFVCLIPTTIGGLLSATGIAGMDRALRANVIAKLAPGGGDGVTISAKGKVVGYALVGQKFTEDRYFNARPSAVGYNAAGSGGSNKGPSNPDYLRDVQTRIDTFLVHNPGVNKADIPSELVTASGSGLDPDLSPVAAKIQVARIATVRGIPAKQLNQLVEEHTEGPLLGLFGPAKVNVLTLNVALDELE